MASNTEPYFQVRFLHPASKEGDGQNKRSTPETQRAYLDWQAPTARRLDRSVASPSEPLARPPLFRKTDTNTRRDQQLLFPELSFHVWARYLAVKAADRRDVGVTMAPLYPTIYPPKSHTLQCLHFEWLAPHPKCRPPDVGSSPYQEKARRGAPLMVAVKGTFEASFHPLP